MFSLLTFFCRVPMPSYSSYQTFLMPCIGRGATCGTGRVCARCASTGAPILGHGARCALGRNQGPFTSYNPSTIATISTNPSRRTRLSYRRQS